MLLSDRAGKWAMVIPSLLLMAVATTQWWRSAEREQVAWVGAGFGMFATVDGFDRTVRILDPGTGEFQSVPPSMLPEALALARVPTRRGEERLLSDLMSSLGPSVDLVVLAPVFDQSRNRLSWREVQIR